MTSDFYGVEAAALRERVEDQWRRETAARHYGPPEETETMTEALTDILRKLARARAGQETAKAESQGAWDRVTATAEYQGYRDLSESLAQLNAEVAGLEARARSLAVEEFGATGDKAPARGVVIKLYRRIAYDTPRVLEWAKEKAPFLLALDTKTFEKSAEAWVQAGAPARIENDARAQVAGDLSSYLEEVASE